LGPDRSLAGENQEADPPRPEQLQPGQDRHRPFACSPLQREHLRHVQRGQVPKSPGSVQKEGRFAAQTCLQLQARHAQPQHAPVQHEPCCLLLPLVLLCTL